MIRTLLIAVRMEMVWFRQRAVSLDTKLCFGLCKGDCFGDDEPAFGISWAISCCCGFAANLRRFLIVPEEVWSFERTGATHDASEIGAS